MNGRPPPKHGQRLVWILVLVFVGVWTTGAPADPRERTKPRLVRSIGNAGAQTESAHTATVKTLGALNAAKAHGEFTQRRAALASEAWFLAGPRGRALEGSESKRRAEAVRAGSERLRAAAAEFERGTNAAAVRTLIRTAEGATQEVREQLIFRTDLQDNLALVAARDRLAAQIAALRIRVQAYVDEAVKARNLERLRKAEALLRIHNERLQSMGIDMAAAASKARALTGNADDTRAREQLAQENADLDAALGAVEARAREAQLLLDAATHASVFPEVILSRGSVALRSRDGSTLALGARGIRPGDEVVTGADGAAAIRGADAFVLEVGRKSRALLADTELVIEFLAGEIRYRKFKTYLKKATSRGFEIRTTYATASVRGSDVVFIHEGKDLVVLVREGKAELALKGGTRVDVPAGHRVRLVEGKTATRVEPLPSGMFARRCQSLWSGREPR